MHIVNHKWTSPSGNWQSTRDRRPPRLRIPKRHSARRVGSDVPLHVDASGRGATKREPAARLLQLRGSFL